MLRTPPFTGARSFGSYSAELRRIIQAFKFRGRKDLAGLLAPLMAAAFTETWTREDMDLVIPVPLHRRRKLERGYNQAGLLGRSLARLIGIPYSQGALERVRHTPPQVGFTSTERLKNLRRAFRCSRPADVCRRRLLLVDDVMTTGATLASATDALLQAGALRVSALTLARTVTRFE
jgi:ComF family protein